MRVKVAVCQLPLDQHLERAAIRRIHLVAPAFVSLPEHYPLPKTAKNLMDAAALFSERKEYLQKLSVELKCTVVGGTLTEPVKDGYHNTCFLFDQGNEIGSYRKINPTERERDAGVIPGNDFLVIKVQGIRIGVLICADVLSMDSFRELASKSCQLVFIPTASPFRPGESIEAKQQRDQSIFLEGARILGCPLIKTCAVGTVFGHPLQGRSLIATPERIISRAQPHQENQPLILFANLEI